MALYKYFSFRFLYVAVDVYADGQTRMRPSEVVIRTMHPALKN